MLWKIAYFVEGKNLEKALAGSAGIALNMEPPQPVTGASVVKSTKGKKISASAGGARKEQFIAWVEAKPVGSRITAVEMKEHYNDVIAKTSNAFSNFQVNAVMKAGLVKRLSKGQYQRI